MLTVEVRDVRSLAVIRVAAVKSQDFVTSQLNYLCCLLCIYTSGMEVVVVPKTVLLLRTRPNSKAPDGSYGQLWHCLRPSVDLCSGSMLEQVLEHSSHDGTPRRPLTINMSADEASTVASASLTTTVPSDFTGGFWQTASTDRIGM